MKSLAGLWGLLGGNHLATAAAQSLESMIAEAVAMDRAMRWAKELIEGVKGHDGTRSAATAAAARQCHVSVAQLRSLIQPSRRPKSLDVGLWFRLRDAYLAALRRRLAALQLEIEVIARLDAGDGSHHDLLRQAQALVDRIEDAARAVDGGNANTLR